MQVGYFHFGINHHDPVGELRCALRAQSPTALDGSVIVLPEGFNIGTFYAKLDGHPNFDVSILSSLTQVSRDYGVSFVAGLIVIEVGGPIPPYNSAFLVTGSGWSLICRKRLADNFTNRYTPSESGFDLEQPIEHCGLRIAALICRDFSDDDQSERIQRLRADTSCSLICVPACTKLILSSVQPGCLVTVDWPNKVFVMANSHPNGSSLMADKKGTVLIASTGAKNEIALHPLTP